MFLTLKEKCQSSTYHSDKLFAIVSHKLDFFLRVRKVKIKYLEVFSTYESDYVPGLNILKHFLLVGIVRKILA